MTENESTFYKEMYGRNRRDRWVDYITGAVGIIILFTIAMLLVPMVPVALRESPVVVDDITILTDMPVCPGDTIEFSSRIIVNEPSIIGIWVSFLDVAENKIIAHHRTETVPIARYKATDRIKMFYFVVPQLLPGEYERIAAFAAINSDTKPEFLVVPFTVSNDCEY